ncbi:MAG: YihY/virulence factor BrkB family protein [Solirubrobacteraceae bacterium]
MKRKLINIFENSIPISILKKIKFIGIDEVSIYDVLKLYFTGIIKGELSSRASGIAYNLFMSMFPLLILIFTLIPFLPNYEIIENYLFEFTLKAILPEEIIFNNVHQYVKENVISKKLEFLSSSMLLTLFFATNGVNSLLEGFSKSYFNIDSYNFIKQYLIAFLLTVGFIISFFLVLTLLYYSSVVENFVYQVNPIKSSSVLIISLYTFILSFLILFIFYSILYYFGSNFKISFKWSLPGALLSTLLFYLSIVFFGYYIKSLTQNNIFYGSIISVIIVMIWIYLNVVIILIGYELNLALSSLKNNL